MAELYDSDLQNVLSMRALYKHGDNYSPGTVGGGFEGGQFENPGGFEGY